MPQKRLYHRPEFWIGIIILLGGIAHLLDKSGVSLVAILENYWPVLFIITGIFQIGSSRYRDTGATILLILIGAALLLSKGGFFSGETFRQYWPQSFLKLLENVLNFVIFTVSSLNITSGVLK